MDFETKRQQDLYNIYTAKTKKHMKKLIPQGSKIIVEPLLSVNHKTEGGLEVVNTSTLEGIILEYSSEFESIYKKGDIVVFSSGAGKVD